MTGNLGKIALLALGVVGCVVVWALAIQSVSRPPISTGTSFEPEPEAEERLMLVVGDSWVTGGTMNDGPTWPYLMDLPDGWIPAADAQGGSGYIGDHSFSALTFDGRLRMLLENYRPNVALVAMGRNDVQHDPDAVIEVARRDLRKMQEAWPDAKIVVFSPFSPEPPIESTVVLTERLRALADELGLDYLDVSEVIGDRRRLIEDDHPNDAGHAVIAAAVERRLADSGVLAAAG